MKISDAIRMVEIAFGYSTSIHDDWKQDEEAEKTAIEAMKKQEPMKVRFKRMPMSMCLSIEEARFYKVCGNCKEAIDGGSYCQECGQKIDWED